jgi:hypothetical protein
MPRQRELHYYVIRKYALDDRGQYTRLTSDMPLEKVARKYAEYRARATSRNTPHDLVTLSRDGQILAHIINGKAVTPQSIVARAGEIARGVKRGPYTLREQEGEPPLPGR